MFARYIRPSLCLLFVMTMLLGIAYPLAMTGLAKAVFPSQAAGSLIRRGDVLVGSSLIGQSFADPRYFWGRPSATAPQPYNGLGSSGSNLGPLNPALLERVAAQVKLFRDADPGNTNPVPVDLVTASASGLKYPARDGSGAHCPAQDARPVRRARRGAGQCSRTQSGAGFAKINE